MIKDLVNDINCHGAIRWSTLNAILPLEEIESLINNKTLGEIPTPLGPLIVLGSAGRQSVGKSGSHVPPPHVGLTQILRREILHELEKKGWAFGEYLKTHKHIIKMQRNTETLLVYVQWTDPPPKRIKRLLMQVLPYRNATLLFTAKKLRPYTKLLQSHPNLQITLIRLLQEVNTSAQLTPPRRNNR
jgi:hypothetical protein